MSQHCNETNNLVNRGKTSDSFANHFASHFEEKNKGKRKQIAIKDVRNMVEMSILWGGNLISCNKSFGKLNCYLCMHERISILESIRKDKKMKVKSCINNNSELYGSCRHKPKFHRFNCLSSADEGQSPEESERVLTPLLFLRTPLGNITNNYLCQEISSNKSVGTNENENGPILVLDV